MRLATACSLALAAALLVACPATKPTGVISPPPEGATTYRSPGPVPTPNATATPSASPSASGSPAAGATASPATSPAPTGSPSPAASPSPAGSPAAVAAAFKANVVPILQNRCQRCHNPSGIAPAEYRYFDAAGAPQHAVVKDKIGEMINAIEGKRMPQDAPGSVTAAELDVLKAWRAAGSPNN